MDEAYQLAQAASDPEGVASQVELFQWCMKHKMYQRAQQQIDVLQFMEIERAQLAHLNRQVRVAIEQYNKNLQRQTTTLQPKVAPKSESPNLESPGQIAQVGYEKTIEILPLPDNGEMAIENSTPRVASARELAEFSKRFKGEAVSKYKRTIELQLIRNCSNAGCHDKNHEGLPLVSQGFGRNISVPKKLSQKNFYTLMQQVDLDNPLQSQLYEYATQPHGGLQEAVYTAKRGQTDTLKEWLLSISTPQAQQAYLQKQFEAANAKIAAQNNTENFSNLPLPGEVRQVSANLPDSSIPSIPNLTPRKEVFAPKDPFDPEIFNRKYGKRD